MNKRQEINAKLVKIQTGAGMRIGDATTRSLTELIDLTVETLKASQTHFRRPHSSEDWETAYERAASRNPELEQQLMLLTIKSKSSRPIDAPNRSSGQFKAYCGILSVLSKRRELLTAQLENGEVDLSVLILPGTQRFPISMGAKMFVLGETRKEGIQMITKVPQQNRIIPGCPETLIDRHDPVHDQAIQEIFLSGRVSTVPVFAEFTRRDEEVEAHESGSLNYAGPLQESELETINYKLQEVGLDIEGAHLHAGLNPQSTLSDSYRDWIDQQISLTHFVPGELDDNGRLGKAPAQIASALLLFLSKLDNKDRTWVKGDQIMVGDHPIGTINRYGDESSGERMERLRMPHPAAGDEAWLATLVENFGDPLATNPSLDSLQVDPQLVKLARDNAAHLKTLRRKTSEIIELGKLLENERWALKCSQASHAKVQQLRWEKARIAELRRDKTRSVADDSWLIQALMRRERDTAQVYKQLLKMTNRIEELRAQGKRVGEGMIRELQGLHSVLEQHNVLAITSMRNIAGLEKPQGARARARK